MMRTVLIASLGLALLAACGETRQQRALTGAAGGGAAGAVVAGPAGAVVGGAAGAATGAYREQIEQRADKAVDRGAEEVTGDQRREVRTAAAATEADLSNREVREAQTALRDIGLYDGEVDGLYGPRTIQAVGKFQEQSDLPRTRALDDRTMDRLMAAAREQNGGQSQGGAQPAPQRQATPPTPPQGEPAGNTPQKGGAQQGD